MTKKTQKITEASEERTTEHPTDPTERPTRAAGAGRKPKCRATGAVTATRIDRWTAGGEEGFWRWMEDIKPRVLHRNNRYEIFSPTERQRAIIAAVFERKPSGPPGGEDSALSPCPAVGAPSGGEDSAAASPAPSPCTATGGPGVGLTDGDDRELKHSIIMNVEPRRHGKSACFAVLCLYFFTTLKNSKVWLLGSTEDHTKRTMFDTLKGIIANTPKLARMVPKDKILGFSISLPR